MAPSQNEYERHQAVYNERLTRLEKESRDAKNREAQLEKDKRRLEERLAALERGSNPALRPRSLTNPRTAGRPRM